MMSVHTKLAYGMRRKKGIDMTGLVWDWYIEPSDTHRHATNANVGLGVFGYRRNFSSLVAFP